MALGTYMQWLLRMGQCPFLVLDVSQVSNYFFEHFRIKSFFLGTILDLKNLFGSFLGLNIWSNSGIHSWYRLYYKLLQNEVPVPNTVHLLW